jgi:hypothetical protein
MKSLKKPKIPAPIRLTTRPSVIVKSTKIRDTSDVNRAPEHVENYLKQSQVIYQFKGSGPRAWFSELVP